MFDKLGIGKVKVYGGLVEWRNMIGKEQAMMDVYFTITGLNHYYGSEVFEKGMKVKLIKEPDYDYDKEAIRVEVKGLGKCGYVANSTYVK